MLEKAVQLSSETSKTAKNQEPIARSVQLPYYKAYVTAFLQTGLFPAKQISFNLHECASIRENGGFSF